MPDERGIIVSLLAIGRQGGLNVPSWRQRRSERQMGDRPMQRGSAGVSLWRTTAGRSGTRASG